MEERTEDSSLETVAEEFEDITVEYQEGFYVYGNGQRTDADNPLPVQIIESDSSSEDSSEEESIHFFEEATEDPRVELENVDRFVNNSRSSSNTDFKNLWKLTINNTQYDVLFPETAPLEVVNGKLYNMGTSTVTGAIIDNSFSDSTYIPYTVSILPLTSNNTQTTVYRYGSRCYITHYSTGTNSNLVTNVSYVQPVVDYRPTGWNLSKADWVICGLLLFSLLVTILGGIFRR